MRPNRKGTVVAALAVAAVGVVVCRGLAGEPPSLPPAASGKIDYATQIRPLLEARCLECHGPDTQESGFRVDRRQSLLRGGEIGEPAVQVGNSGESHLIRIVSGGDPALVMPPDGEPLSDAEVGLLRAWIDQGMGLPEPGTPPGDGSTVAGRPDHWSLQPIEKPPVPQIAPPTDGDSLRDPLANPIDAFVVERLGDAGLTLSPAADSATLIRRVYLDMLGLLPSPDQVEAFVQDSRPDAYPRLVDRVLADPHHGERWARHWLDVIRFAESNGFETNHERPNAYHYRDYVVRALNDDKPFDRFIFEQLAGDTVGVNAATGYLVAGSHDIVASPDPVLTAMQRQDELADMVNTTGTSLLGLTIGCARCHNHKFDPITQVDFFAMQAIFAGVRHGERQLTTPQTESDRRQAEQIGEQLADLDRRLQRLMATSVQPRLRPAVSAETNVESFAPRTARFVRMEISATSNGIEPCIDEFEIWTSAGKGQPRRNVALASAGAIARASGEYPGNSKHKLAHLNDGRFGNDRSWISNEHGRGWIEIELAEAVSIDRIVWGRDRRQKYTDRVPQTYRIEIAEEAGQWQVVASSANRLPLGIDADPLGLRLAHLPAADATHAKALVTERDQLQRRLTELRTPRLAYVGRFQTPEPTHRLYRGDPAAPREPVAPDTVAVLGALGLPLDAPESQRRVALAESIIDPDNPLTARVIANRLWHYHFGTGLVSTPSDFGAMGAAPSHPDLLDWLSAELRDEDWSLKHLHRLILLSATYRQSSHPHAAGMAKDADSRLMWRYPPRRLEAEAIRDNILRVSGSLDTRMAGPGFLMFHPNSNYARNWIPKDQFGPPEFRRMLYATDLRMEHDAVFGAFDCPNGGQVAPRRTESTTPIQALNLFNSDFILDQAERFARRVRREVGEDPSAQVERVFQLALGRGPDAGALPEAVRLVEQHGLSALCRAIFNANGFLFLR